MDSIAGDMPNPLENIEPAEEEEEVNEEIISEEPDSIEVPRAPMNWHDSDPESDFDRSESETEPETEPESEPDDPSEGTNADVESESDSDYTEPESEAESESDDETYPPLKAPSTMEDSHSLGVVGTKPIARVPSSSAVIPNPGFRSGSDDDDVRMGDSEEHSGTDGDMGEYIGEDTFDLLAEDGGGRGGLTVRGGDDGKSAMDSHQLAEHAQSHVPAKVWTATIQDDFDESEFEEADEISHDDEEEEEDEEEVSEEESDTDIGLKPRVQGAASSVPYSEWQALLAENHRLREELKLQRQVAAERQTEHEAKSQQLASNQKAVEALRTLLIVQEKEKNLLMGQLQEFSIGKPAVREDASRQDKEVASLKKALTSVDLILDDLVARGLVSRSSKALHGASTVARVEEALHVLLMRVLGLEDEVRGARHRCLGLERELQDFRESSRSALEMVALAKDVEGLQREARAAQEARELIEAKCLELEEVSRKEAESRAKVEAEAEAEGSMGKVKAQVKALELANEKARLSTLEWEVREKSARAATALARLQKKEFGWQHEEKTPGRKLPEEKPAEEKKLPENLHREKPVEQKKLPENFLSGKLPEKLPLKPSTSTIEVSGEQEASRKLEFSPELGEKVTVRETVASSKEARRQRVVGMLAGLKRQLDSAEARANAMAALISEMGGRGGSGPSKVAITGR